MEKYEVYHVIDHCRFEVVGEGYTAHVKYLIKEGTIDVRHTIVPKEIGGRGIARILVETVYEWGSEQGLEPRATCSYAASLLKRKGINVPVTEDALKGNCCAI